MTISDLRYCEIHEWAEDPCRICRPFGSSNAVLDDDPDRARMRQAATRAIAAFARASEVDDLGIVLPELIGGFRGAREALLEWLELLESIVQVAERRYGSRPGRGRFKATQVKAALQSSIEKSDSSLRGLADFLGPGVVNLIVDAALLVIVSLLNERNTLWSTNILDGALAKSSWRFKIWVFVNMVLGKILNWVGSPPVLDPQLHAEVQAIIDSGSDPLSLIEDVVAAADWVIAHPETVRAMMEVVALACDEAEELITATGPEKQTYARNIILIAMEGMGFRLGGASLAIAEAIIDTLIDFVVSLNNKHLVFVHRR